MDLSSLPTCSRAENLLNLGTVIRLGKVLVDLWLPSNRSICPPASFTFDIDDTLGLERTILIIRWS